MLDGSFNRPPEEVRAEVAALLEAEGLTKVAAARAAAINDKTFSAWFNGTYQGDNAKVSSQVDRWLASRKDQKQASAILPKAVGYVETSIGKKVWDILTFSQITSKISVVSTGAGVGKTVTGERYCEMTPNAWMVCMDPMTSGANNCLLEILTALDLSEKSPRNYGRALRHFLSGKKALLIIDEAQFLSIPALETLRILAHKGGFGLVFMGNETVYARLEGASRSAEFAQLFSRVGMRMVGDAPTTSDADKILSAWEIEDGQARKFLLKIAAKPGALRGMVMVIEVAATLAAGSGEAMDFRHIQAAWDQLWSGPRK